MSVDGTGRGTGRGAGSPGRRLGAVLAVVLSLVLALLLLWPDGEVVRQGVLRVYLFFFVRGAPASLSPEVYAAVLNVAVFVPLGWVGVLLLRRPAVRVVLALVALSVAVELLQALPGVDRDPSLLDVACNSLGGAIGALAASLVRRGGHGGPGSARDQPRLDQPGDEGRDVGGERLRG